MSKYKGKKVLVVGFGRTGAAVSRYLIKNGAKVTVTDVKQKHELKESLKATQDLKLDTDFGKHTPQIFTESDMIVVSPGVPRHLTALEAAREKNIPIVGELDLVAKALKEPLIAVTGTNGKTTSTVLLREIFKADGRNAFTGGNIGTPLVEYFNGKKDAEMIIAELSSFQLENVGPLVPAVAVFTNISEDHLDRYPDMESYVYAKKRLLQVCDKNSFVVLNYDDPHLARFAQETTAKVLYFTKRNPIELGGDFAEQFAGAYYVPGSHQIVAKFSGKEEVYHLKKLRLFGDHNKENLMAAICAARAQGVKPKSIQTVIDQFQGIEHRLEFVTKKNGVYFFNDSKATNVHSVGKSLSSFKRSPIVLIAGGRDKDSDFTRLADLVHQKCKILVLVGEAKEKINRMIGDYSETFLVGTFEEAVLLAYQKSRIGDIILLSPGCSSFDMFRNYEERGDYFKKLISQL